MGIFTEILLILALSIVVIALCRRLKFPPLLGYIVVGMLISSVARQHFTNFSGLSELAKYGVVFLLFTIGLEFSMSRLMTMRGIVFGLGGLQMLICGGLTFAVCTAFKLPPSVSFVLAISFAMSSTAIVSKILTEQGSLSGNIGRIAMGILIFQDMMIVPAIIITGVFAENAGGKIGTTLLVELVKGVITFIVLVFVGKEVFTPAYNEVARARSPELFMLATLFAALSAAYFSEQMGMPSALGAFLAGTVLAGTPYHHQIENDIRPFRDMLLGVFFIGVGALIDVHFFFGHLLGIVVIAFLILSVNFFSISFFLVKFRAANQVEALKIGLLLSQAGEFGFVLVSLAHGYNFLQNQQTQIILGAIILSMLTSIILIRFQPLFLPKIQRLMFGRGQPLDFTDLSFLNLQKNAVVIAGYSRIGQWVAKSLDSHRHHYIALELDPTLVNQARLVGEHVIYADAGDCNTLQKIHFQDAKAAVITFQDPVISLRVLEQMRLINPDVPILVRTKDDKDIQKLMSAGATEVIPDTLEASLMLSMHVLVSLGLDLSAAVKWADHLREDRYQILKAYFKGDSGINKDEDLNAPVRVPFVVSEGAFCLQKSLKTLDLALFNVRLSALQRGGKTLILVPPDTHLMVEDVLTLEGTQPDLEKAQRFLLAGSAD